MYNFNPDFFNVPIFQNILIDYCLKPIARDIIPLSDIKTINETIRNKLEFLRYISQDKLYKKHTYIYFRNFLEMYTDDNYLNNIFWITTVDIGGDNGDIQLCDFRQNLSKLHFKLHKKVDYNFIHISFIDGDYVGVFLIYYNNQAEPCLFTAMFIIIKNHNNQIDTNDIFLDNKTI